MRNAHHAKELKDGMIARLKKIEGQIRGISRMIDEDVYCDDILNQVAAVESALNGVKQLLLEAHMKSCIVEQIEEGKYEVIDELLRTIRKLM
jgi:DNA-binding FrmR family transcriptional regulator